jgi:hypothetical protein
MTTENEQMVLDAFERGKAFGFAEGLRQQQAEIQQWKLKHDILAVTSCACGLKKASGK